MGVFCLLSPVFYGIRIVGFHTRASNSSEQFLTSRWTTLSFPPWFPEVSPEVEFLLVTHSLAEKSQTEENQANYVEGSVLSVTAQ